MRWINFFFFVELRQGFTQGTDQSVRRQRRPVMQGDGLKLTGQRLLTERLSLRINNPHRIPAFNMWVHAGGRVKEQSHFSYSMWQSTVECVFVLSSHISDLLCKIPCDLRSTHRVWKAPRAALHTLGCARLLPRWGPVRREVEGVGRQKVSPQLRRKWTQTTGVEVDLRCDNLDFVKL